MSDQESPSPESPPAPSVQASSADSVPPSAPPGSGTAGPGKAPDPRTVDTVKPRSGRRGEHLRAGAEARTELAPSVELPGHRIAIEPGTVLAGRYQVIEQIGAGGMGAVFSAEDRNRGERVALKVLLPELLADPDANERFQAEARISSSLSHPAIVNVFDVHRDGDLAFLTMELLTGRTLRAEMLSRTGKGEGFSVAEVVDLGSRVADALHYAHRYTVHRDVKPENIWLCEDGSVRLMDFGIARIQKTTQQTVTGMAMGTAYYMAPEQMKGAADVDEAADQYSLGVVLFELLTGEIPAGRVGSVASYRKDIPVPVAEAIDRALSPKPAHRFRDMAAFEDTLRRAPRLIESRAGRVLGATAVVLFLLFVGHELAVLPRLRTWLEDPQVVRERRRDLARRRRQADSRVAEVLARPAELARKAEELGAALKVREDALLEASRSMEARQTELSELSQRGDLGSRAVQLTGEIDTGARTLARDQEEVDRRRDEHRAAVRMAALVAAHLDDTGIAEELEEARTKALDLERRYREAEAAAAYQEMLARADAVDGFSGRIRPTVEAEAAYLGALERWSREVARLGSVPENGLEGRELGLPGASDRAARFAELTGLLATGRIEGVAPGLETLAAGHQEAVEEARRAVEERRRVRGLFRKGEAAAASLARQDAELAALRPAFQAAEDAFLAARYPEAAEAFATLRGRLATPLARLEGDAGKLTRASEAQAEALRLRDELLPRLRRFGLEARLLEDPVRDLAHADRLFEASRYELAAGAYRDAAEELSAISSEIEVEVLETGFVALADEERRTQEVLGAGFDASPEVAAAAAATAEARRRLAGRDPEGGLASLREAAARLAEARSQAHQRALVAADERFAREREAAEKEIGALTGAGMARPERFDRAIRVADGAARLRQLGFPDAALPLVEEASSLLVQTIESLRRDREIAKSERDAHGRTKLHLAAAAGRSEEVRGLLALSADPAATDRTGGTALHAASGAGHLEAVRALLEAAGKGGGEARRLTDLPDATGRTALHLAAAAGQVGVVAALLGAGADPHPVDGEGNTPLHLAISRGSLPVVNDLASRMERARLNLTNARGQTPLDLALASGAEEVAKLLRSLDATENPTVLAARREAADRQRRQEEAARQAEETRRKAEADQKRRAEEARIEADRKRTELQLATLQQQLADQASALKDAQDRAQDAARRREADEAAERQAELAAARTRQRNLEEEQRQLLAQAAAERRRAEEERIKAEEAARRAEAEARERREREEAEERERRRRQRVNPLEAIDRAARTADNIRRTGNFLRGLFGS